MLWIRLLGPQWAGRGVVFGLEDSHSFFIFSKNMVKMNLIKKVFLAFFDVFQFGVKKGGGGMKNAYFYRVKDGSAGSIAKWYN